MIEAQGIRPEYEFAPKTLPGQFGFRISLGWHVFRWLNALITTLSELAERLFNPGQREALVGRFGNWAVSNELTRH